MKAATDKAQADALYEWVQTSLAEEKEQFEREGRKRVLDELGREIDQDFGKESKS
jgi:hypothetical protein